jgi:hypothetical protein
MKDYYDLWTLSHHFAFEGRRLYDALRATLKRRGRSAPSHTPTGLTDEFGSDPTKIRQWNAFIGSRHTSEVPADLALVVAAVRTFAGPIVNAIATDQPFEHHWAKGGPWVSSA